MAAIEYSVRAPERTEVAPAPVTLDDVLIRAADLLEEFGWCKEFAAVDSDGQPAKIHGSSAAAFCAIGAIYRACSELGADDEVTEPIEDRWSEIPDWNDSLESKEPMVMALRAGLPQFRSH